MNNYSEFKKEDKIYHDVLGIGNIIDIDDATKCYVIKFDDIETARHLYFRVKLKKVDE